MIKFTIYYAFGGLTVQRALKKLTYGKDASSNCKLVLDNGSVAGLVSPGYKYFCDTLEKVDEPRFKISHIKLLLNTLPQELTNP